MRCADGRAPSPSTLCSSMLRLDASAPRRLLAPRAGSLCLNGAGRAPPLQQRASRWCSLHESGASHGAPSRIALAIVVPVRCAVHPPPRWVHGQTGAAPTGDISTAGVTLHRAKSCRQACRRPESTPILTPSLSLSLSLPLPLSLSLSLLPSLPSSLFPSQCPSTRRSLALQERAPASPRDALLPPRPQSAEM